MNGHTEMLHDFDQISICVLDSLVALNRRTEMLHVLELLSFCVLDSLAGRAVIDNASIDESTKKPYRLSISKKAQHIDSYAN